METVLIICICFLTDPQGDVGTMKAMCSVFGGTPICFYVYSIYNIVYIIGIPSPDLTS